jgi:uncharacterized membrane protein YbhN (UPF0104 family)
MNASSETRRPSFSERHRWWPIAKKLLTYLFFIMVVVLLVALAKRVDWGEVITTLRGYSMKTLLLAGLATLGSYLVYTSFDLLGKRYTRHSLPAAQILPVTFVCYAFNLNLSAWVGGIAFRYRLYSRLGLRNSVITQIFTLSLMTNWLGYMALGGTVFALGWVKMPESWSIGTGTLRLIGVLLVAVTLIYLGLCAFSKRRSWTIRGHEIGLPSLRMAATQLVLGGCNWGLMALVVYIMLQEKIDYPTVLGVLLISSIAGVVTHIPAGLGVLETVFVTLLQDQVSKGSMLAALIGYRVLYFLIPLLLASLVYLLLESQAKKLRSMNSGKQTG